MTLLNIPLSLDEIALPASVRAFLKEANRRENIFMSDRPIGIRGFVPSCHETIYRALRVIDKTNLAPGNSFCEWGSGFGVTTLLAAMLGFDAYGIEVDRELCDASRVLADQFPFSCEFIHGSFVPTGSDRLIDRAFARAEGELSLETHTDDAYEELGLDVRDFDLIFAYPWPNDEHLTAALFDKFASDGALLLTYAGLESVRLRRKSR